MPPSPHIQRRAKVRRQALDLAEKGLNRRGGPVDHGSPAAQKRAADRLESERAQDLGEMQRQKQVQGKRPETDQVEGRRSFQLFRNRTKNDRAGQTYRTIPKRGGVIHEYAGGKRVFVPKTEHKRAVGPTEGTGNRVHRAREGSSQQMISDLARRRATENRPKAKRNLFAKVSVAPRDTDTGGARDRAFQESYLRRRKHRFNVRDRARQRS